MGNGKRGNYLGKRVDQLKGYSTPVFADEHGGDRRCYEPCGTERGTRSGRSTTFSGCPCGEARLGQGKHQNYQAGDIPGETQVALLEDSHQCRNHRTGRADHRGTSADVRTGGKGDRAVSDRKGSTSRGPSLAGNLPPRFLSRRGDNDQRAPGNLARPVGHQSRGTRGSDLRASWRPHAGYK